MRCCFLEEKILEGAESYEACFRYGRESAMPIIDSHYMEKMDKINKLPLNQMALKFLNGTHEDPIEDRFPHALQLV